MKTYLHPEDVKLPNTEFIIKLKKLIKYEGTRHNLIGLCIKLGSYKARSELPNGFFQKVRHTSSRTHEAAYIAEKGAETLEQLAVKSSQEVILALEDESETLSENNLRESDISRILKQIHDPSIIGKKSEVRILKLESTNSYHTHKDSPRSLNQLLYNEAEEIISALAYEAKRQQSR